MDRALHSYAFGLYRLGEEKKIGEKISEDLDNVLEVLNENNTLSNILKSYIFSTNEKKALIEKLFKKNVDINVVNFLKLLIDKNRIFYLKEIIKEYKNIILSDEGFVNGDLFTPIKLSDEKIKDVEQKVCKIFDRKIKLNQTIDKSLIAGIKVMVEGKMLDASIKGNLEKLKQEVGLEY